jgi:hypothetical protein
MNLERMRFAARDLLPRPSPPPLADALAEGIRWVYRAQDAGTDRGVSHSYELGRGWLPSYPETTGYLIPTLLNWSLVSGDGEARRRALEMAAWECSIQFPEGGIQASVIGRGDRPVVFNTGQVLFGWVAAYRASGDETYLDAASRGTAWLVRTLGDGETWTSHGNLGEDRSHAYNARVTWGVLEVLRLRPDPGVEAAMRRTLDWVLAREVGPGWFDRNCLTDDRRPLLHTIAYTAQGLLESGLLLEAPAYVDAARRTADALLGVLSADGRLAGRFDRDWHGAARWACLTGIAQTAIVWHRLFALSGEERYAEGARRAGAYLRSVQHLAERHPGIRGALAGSYPVWGDYCRYRCPNWATKFALDAYLLEAHPGLDRRSEYHPG